MSKNSGTKYLQKAIDGLKGMNISSTDVNSSVAPISNILGRISHISPEKTLVIARTLANQQVFDNAVSNEISHISFGTRYEDIVKSFDSIRDDSKRLISQAERSSPSIGDRVSNVVMKLTRGDISDRFDKIRVTMNDVLADVGTQVTRERNILEIYKDYRGSIKEAEVLAHEIEQELAIEVETAKAEVLAKTNILHQAVDASPQDKARLELERDEAKRVSDDVDARWQIALDLANNLKVAYSVTEVTMAKLVESHVAKDRLYKQAVTFMSTNGTVLTALKATYTGLVGLHEATRTIDAMHKGISDSLEVLAVTGTEITKEAYRKGFGPSIRAESVKKLVDSVVEFQESSIQITNEMRKEAKDNANEISNYVEDGKRRIADLIAKGSAQELLVQVK